MTGIVTWRADEPYPGASQEGARKYTGATAEGYRAKREDTPKWQAEDKWLKDMLKDIPSGNWILDCPVGDGRFLPFYHEKGFLVRAVDISEDMLKQAIRNGANKGVRFEQGSILDLPLQDKSVDASVMVRMTRWLSEDENVRAMQELQRVTRKRIVFTARVRNHPYARPYELFQSALDGWKFARDEELSDPNYRMLALEPV